MKTRITLFALLVVALSAAGCSSAFYAQSNAAANDLYAVHNRTDIARKQQAEAEARKAEAEARRAELEALLAEREAELAASRLSDANNTTYSSVLADDYESAYARRLRGFESPTYRMPSSYTNARYSSTFHYVSAYDPAFYNIIVMGDEVWVEPKYVTAMFGSWGRPVYSNAWYYGWSAPALSIGFGSWGWNIGLSWYDPWFFGSWHNPWWGWHGPHWWGYGPHHPHWYPGWHGGGHRPSYGLGGGYRPGHSVVHRPSNSRHTHPYGSAGQNINRSQSGNRNWSSGTYQGGGNKSQNRYNKGGSVTRQSNSGSSSNRSWFNNSSGNSSRRSSSSGYSSGSSSSRNSGYSSGSSGSSRSSGSSGSSRGGYSGSSSRGR